MSDKKRYWKEIAQQLAESDHEQQGIFLNEFGRWLFLYCKGMNGLENQVARLSDVLDGCADLLAREIVAFLDLKKEEEAEDE